MENKEQKQRRELINEYIQKKLIIEVDILVNILRDMILDINKVMDRKLSKEELNTIIISMCSIKEENEMLELKSKINSIMNKYRYGLEEFLNIEASKINNVIFIEHLINKAYKHC